MLKDLEFTNLLLVDNNIEQSMLKGTPDNEFALFDVGPDLYDDLHYLVKIVREAYHQHSDSSLSLRIGYDNIFFRSAIYDDINLGRVYFLRRLPDVILDFRELGGLPDRATNWLLRKDHSKGLVLFSGAQNSGKTTSAAAYIAARLSLYGGHAVTFEQPVEMPLSGKHGNGGWCFQREIASENELPAHIERTHRYASPNIILIGEIRTPAAAAEALRVALGSQQQLVVATIHGIDLGAALSRMLTWATESYGNVAREDLSEVLAAVIHQRLVHDGDGSFKLEVPQLLLLPFHNRAHLSAFMKLRDGNTKLDEEMRDLRNRLMYGGEGDLY
jgi:twitching motility protein PilT